MGAVFNFGARPEIDILVPSDGAPEVTGRKRQQKILLRGDDPQYR